MVLNWFVVPAMIRIESEGIGQSHLPFFDPGAHVRRRVARKRGSYRRLKRACSGTGQSRTCAKCLGICRLHLLDPGPSSSLHRLTSAGCATFRVCKGGIV